jgi:hypothetical protein
MKELTLLAAVDMVNIMTGEPAGKLLSKVQQNTAHSEGPQ